MENEKERMYFFKIILAGLHSQRLKIPPDFAEHIRKDMGDEKTTVKAAIKGVGGSWLVDLNHTREGLYIEAGWDKVMADNVLGDYEFLLFRYDGKLCFNLQIFQKSGIQRISPVTTTQKSDKLGLFLSSEIPHFKFFMKHYNVGNPYTLRFPLDFSRKHFSGCGTGESRKIRMENIKKEVWEVKATMYQSNFLISTGWREFVRANNLKEGNVCIFQYLGKYRLRVLLES